MNLKIIKYNAGNIQSVLYALERIGVSAEVTDDIEKIRSADKVIFPGVGEASSAMKSLRENKLDELILHHIKFKKLLSATLIKNCVLAECGSEVRAIAIVPFVLAFPLLASFSIGVCCGFCSIS